MLKSRLIKFLIACSIITPSLFVISCNNNGDKDDDFDGLKNSIDPDPKNNTYNMSIKFNDDRKESGVFPVTIDYREFLKEGYSPSLALLASFIFNDVHKGVDIKNNVYKPSEDLDLPIFGQMGGEDFIRYRMGNYIECQYDRSDVYMAHHTFVDENNIPHQVFLNSIFPYVDRKGWISNFDVGATEPYDSSKVSSFFRNFWYPYTDFSEWTHHLNHKGFDVTSNRLLKAIENYIKQHQKDGVDKIIFITGQSRGAAITQLVAKALIDENYKVRAYAFNSPTVTKDIQDTDKEVYRKSIFNIINDDDFVSRVPLKDYWGYTYYGSQNVVKLRNYIDEYKNFIKRDYICLSQTTIKSIERQFALLSCTEKPEDEQDDDKIKAKSSNNNVYSYRYPSDDFPEESIFNTEAEMEDFYKKITMAIPFLANPSCVRVSKGYRIPEAKWFVKWETSFATVISMLRDYLTGNFDNVSVAYLFMFRRLITEVFNLIISGEIDFTLEGFVYPHEPNVSPLLATILNKEISNK